MPIIEQSSASKLLSEAKSSCPPIVGCWRPSIVSATTCPTKSTINAPLIHRTIRLAEIIIDVLTYLGVRNFVGLVPSHQARGEHLAMDAVVTSGLSVNESESATETSPMPACSVALSGTKSRTLAAIARSISMAPISASSIGLHRVSIMMSKRHDKPHMQRIGSWV
ncbi:MAG: hypothetical protein QMC73_14880 [Myxococcota bacterium]